ncbi:MAG TPA: polymer-forming cytoskeletal protein [Burkholderiales bacterium]
MFGRKEPKKPQNRIDSLIGQGTRIEGNVTFSGGLRVDGQVIGDVTGIGDKASMLVLSEQARIEGAIRVSHLVINGTVAGPVYAMDYLELQGKARINGDVHYKNMEIQMGAVVAGNLVHQDSQYSEKVVAFKPASGD